MRLLTMSEPSRVEMVLPGQYRTRSHGYNPSLEVSWRCAGSRSSRALIAKMIIESDINIGVRGGGQHGQAEAERYPEPPSEILHHMCVATVVRGLAPSPHGGARETGSCFFPSFAGPAGAAFLQPSERFRTAAPGHRTVDPATGMAHHGADCTSTRGARQRRLSRSSTPLGL